MADTYTPEEINEIFGAYNRAIKDGTPITADLTRQMKDAATGVKNYTANLNNSLKGLGNTALKLAENLKDGADGASVFNDSLEATAEAANQYVQKWGTLGKILGGAAVAAAKYAVAANKQGDALYKSYQDLTRFGQGTARGMDDVFSTMQKFSYGIADLDKMTALLKENSKTLALFGGTVAQGTEKMANVADQFKNSDLQAYFLKMGISVDNQNRGIAGYIKQLTMLGQTQGKNQAELTRGAAAYLKEMEGLTRLTGQTREEMEQQRDAAMAIDQFAVQVSEMGDQGKELQKVFNMLMSVDPTGAKARAFAESVTGFAVGSKEQNQLFQLSGGKLGGMIDGLTKGTLSAAQFMDQLAPKGAQLEMLKGMARVPGQLRDFAGGYSDIIKLNSKNWTESAETADKSTEVTSDLTDAQVELRQAELRTRDALQKMINDGVLPTTRAMAKLAGITDTAAEGSKSLWDKFWGGVKKVFSGEDDTSETGGDVNKAAATIRERESGGNYQAQAKKTSASGAYQFIDTTWQTLTKKYGIGEEYSKAKLAPKDIQDAIAKKYIAEILKESGGDISKVPLKWYTGNIQGKISQQGLDANNGLTPEAYQKKWMETYKKQAPSESAERSGPTDKPSSGTTGPTMPAGDAAVMDRVRASQQSITGASGFQGILSGPASGYKPNITMHGTEELKITPNNQLDQPGATPVNSMMTQQTTKLDQIVQALQGNNNQEMMGAQIDKLDRLIQIMQNQVNISTKILQASR